MVMRMIGIGIVAAGLVVAGAVPAEESPYAGAQGRDIKALAPEEVEALLSGQGMGLAMAAELNRYPGPRHALDLAEPLGLTTAQRDAAAAAFADVKREAVPLGRAIVADERALEALFAGGTADRAAVEALVMRIAERQGRLRSLHLAAHVKMRQILTPAQIARYDELRGYGAGADQGHDHQQMHQP